MHSAWKRKPWNIVLVILLVLVIILASIFVFLRLSLSEVPLPFVPQNAQAAYVFHAGKVSVLTAHNDTERTGQNLQETQLKFSTVNQNQFGLLFSYQVDGQIQAQPLYVPNVMMQGKRHNVVYIVTTKDIVYAFDADNRTLTRPLWADDLGVSGGPGILGTPVIDLSLGSGMLFVVTNTEIAAVYIHALDITTGDERLGSPVSIEAPGFNPYTTHERTGLLLLNGVIYGGWYGSEFTHDVEHGWVFAFDEKTLRMLGAYNTTPDSTVARNPGSVWQSTNGLAGDSAGNVYPIIANGPFDVNSGKADYGDSIVKLHLANTKLTVSDYFAPFDQRCLLQKDYDLGSAGALLLPDQSGAHPHLLFTGSKEGRLYLVDRDNLGKYTADDNLDCSTSEETRTDIDKVVQESPLSLIPGLFMAPTYWRDSNGKQYIYVSGSNADTGQGDVVKVFQMSNDGRINFMPVSQSSAQFGYPGAGLVVSSNGSKEGILWALEPGKCTPGGCDPRSHGVLHAYDATNLRHELYNSEQNGGRDGMDSYMKFTSPIVVDGKVFVCSQSYVYIYGLLNQ